MGTIVKQNNCCNCCCPQPCPCPEPEDCTKMQELVTEAAAYSAAILLGLNTIYTIFANPNTCTNLANSEALIDEIEVTIGLLYKTFKSMADSFNCDCFYCYNHVYRIIYCAMAETKAAKVFWKGFIDLLKCNPCECVECDAFYFTRKTLFSALAADAEVRSLVTLLKDQ